ncbi:MAG: hypothetical protein ABSD62_01440 [Candidatus Limnocylindrales bacterium]|jgi:hypothetical protein
MGELIRLAPRIPTPEERLRDAHAELIGARLRWKRYRDWPARHPRPSSPSEACRAPFSLKGVWHSSQRPGSHAAFRARDDYLWLCALCFESRGAWFGWHVLEPTPDPRGRLA